MRLASQRGEFATSVVVSVMLHVGLVAALLFVRPPEAAPRLQPFKVVMHAALKGKPSEGVVVEKPPAAASAPPTTAPRNNSSQTRKAPLSKTPPKATKEATRASASTAKASGAKTVVDSKSPPVTKATDAQAAGSRSGGQGTDVVEALFNGIDFPSPDYLRQIVNKIMTHFVPPPGVNYVADFSFDIDRKGCMTNFRTRKGSGNRPFDASARSAIEIAGKNCGFGRLPDSWSDDILSVVFTFDPNWK